MVQLARMTDTETDITDVVADLLGALGPERFDALARAVAGQRRGEALGFLAAYAVPDLVPEARATACVDALLSVTGGFGERRRGLDGEGVREDLRVQPCQAEVADLAEGGHLHAAALLAAVHEGYEWDAAFASAGILAAELAGTPVALVPTAASDVPQGERYVARIGKRLVAGANRTLGDTLVIDAGEPVPVARVAQAWRRVPLDRARAEAVARVEALLSAGGEGLAGRIVDALSNGEG